MPLPRKLLNDDEELLAEMRPHWVFFAGPLAVAALVWVAILALVIGWHGMPSWTSYPLLAIGAVPTLWLAGRLVRWRCYTLALTTTRILVRHGVISRDTVQLRLQRITEINLAQLFWERVLGTGRLVIDVQGEDDAVVLEYVRKPAVVQRVINAQINALVGGGAAEVVPAKLRPRGADRRTPGPGLDDTLPGRGAPATAQSPWPTPPAGSPATPTPAGQGVGIRERLIELDDLRQRGIITEAEFTRKKAELLARM